MLNSFSCKLSTVTRDTDMKNHLKIYSSVPSRMQKSWDFWSSATAGVREGRPFISQQENGSVKQGPEQGTGCAACHTQASCGVLGEARALRGSG